MSSQAHKLKIGLFVVVSLLLGVAIVIWLGARPYFEESQTAVAFFTESVQGLQSDSPVKFRGVTVGRVKKIQLAPDGRLIEVIMSLTRNFKITPDLGIYMNLMGLTGLKYLEMNTFRPTIQPEPIELSFEPKYPVIPTYPSDIREIGNALDNLFQKVKDVDVATISQHLLRVTARLDKLLSDPKLDTIGADAAAGVIEMKEAAKKLNQEVTRIQRSKGITKTLEKASELMGEGTETARSADRLIRRADNNLSQLSQKLNRSADNLMDITRQWKENPFRSFFFGGGKEGEKKR